MGYPQEFLGQALLRKSNAHDTAENVAAAVAVHGGFLVCQGLTINRLMFYISTTIAANNVAPVVEFNRRPTYNSSSGEILIGQLTLANGTAAGKVVYKDLVDPVSLVPGDELSYEHVTQATDSGTAAGAGFYGILAELEPEVPGNESNMVASA